MRTIDIGEGGGQLLRTALGLSVATNTAVRLENIRESRPDPGLKPQHAAVVSVLKSIANASVTPYSIGTETLTFEPTTPRGGSYEYDIGTAGNVFLLFDAVLPLAFSLTEPLSVHVSGGTDTKWAPTSHFYQTVKLPLIRQFSINVYGDVDQYGFYPKGGGKATIQLLPSTPTPVDLSHAAQFTRARIYSLETTTLSGAEVATRQAETLHDGLRDRNLPIDEVQRITVSASSPGSAITLQAEGPDSIAGFSTVGEKGTPAEAVANTCLKAFDSFMKTPGAVDPHSADQVIPILALTGGQLRIGQTTSHIDTLLDLLDTFGAEYEKTSRADSCELVFTGLLHS